MPQVGLEMTGEERELVRSVLRAEKKLLQMEDKLKRINRTGTRAGKDVSKGLGQIGAMARTAASALGVGGGLFAAVQALKGEFQSIVETQKEAAAIQIPTASARKDLIRNLGGKTDDDIRKALEGGSEIAFETKVDERAIFGALASAVSASGQDIELSLEAVEQSAKFLADKPAEIGLFAGALLDLSKVTKSRSAEVNQGFLQLSGSLSRVVDPAQQAKNLPPSLIGQQQAGATPAEAAALFGAISEGSGDFLGALTGTATIKLSQQLRDFFQEKDVRAATAGQRESLGRDLTTGERIEFLQERQDLGGRFLEGAEFENKARGPIEALIQNLPSTIDANGQRIRSVADAFRENLDAMKGQGAAAPAVAFERPESGAIGEALAEFFATDAGALAATEKDRAFRPLTTGEQVETLQERPEMAVRFLETAKLDDSALSSTAQLLLNPPAIPVEGPEGSSADFARLLDAGLQRGRGVTPRPETPEVGISRDLDRLSDVQMEAMRAPADVETDATAAFEQRMRGISSESLRQRNLDELEFTAGLSRTHESALSSIQLGDLEGAEGGVNREFLDKQLKASGAGFVERKLAGLEFEARTNIGRSEPTAVAADIIQRRADVVGAPEVSIPGGRIGLEAARPDVQREAPTGRAVDIAGQLDKLATELRESAEASRAVAESNRQLLQKPEREGRGASFSRPGIGTGNGDVE